jgi:hypothetical protein
MTVWTHQLLDLLRQIGDPPLDPVPGKTRGWRAIDVAPADAPEAKDAPKEAQLLVTWRKRSTGALPDGDGPLHEYWTTDAAHMDARRLDVAHDLFAIYGGEIGATLLLASLPNAYAAEAGATVLAATHELQSNTRRRIGETAQFVIDVLSPEDEPVASVVLPPGAKVSALPPGSQGYVRTRTTRLTHAVIRSLLTGDGAGRWPAEAEAGVPGRPLTKLGVPINQEDLLGTLCTFTVTVFEVMEKLGVPWNDEAEQAYLDLWDRAGELLGIGTKEVTSVVAKAEPKIVLPDEYIGCLRPKTPTEARELMALIRQRSWPVPLPGRVLGPFANANGKVLVRSLLDELQAAMPRGMERLPLFVMRYLVDDTAHELLGLGGGGLANALLRWPTEQDFTRIPGRHLGRGAVQATMRLAANDISRRAFVHFIRQREADKSQAPFRFPGFPTGFATISMGRSDPAPVTASDPGSGRGGP